MRGFKDRDQVRLPRREDYAGVESRNIKRASLSTHRKDMYSKESKSRKHMMPTDNSKYRNQVWLKDAAAGD